jgi:hypothetical protein
LVDDQIGDYGVEDAVGMASKLLVCCARPAISYVWRKSVTHNKGIFARIFDASAATLRSASAGGRPETNARESDDMDVYVVEGNGY